MRDKSRLYTEIECLQEWLGQKQVALPGNLCLTAGTRGPLTGWPVITSWTAQTSTATEGTHGS